MFNQFINKVEILDKNFLTLEECLLTKNKLLSVKYLWQCTKIKYFNFFPYGLYSVPFNVYQNNVLLYKSTMLNLFSDLYERIKFKLNELFQIEINYSEKFNYPGFHISNAYEMQNANFHTDDFKNLHLLAFGKDKLYFRSPKIFSFIIPISLPLEGAGLLIRNTFLSDRQLLKYDSILNYELGMLAIWDGDMQHSIKPFKPTDELDLRITLQFHVAIANNKGYIFW